MGSVISALTQIVASGLVLLNLAITAAPHIELGDEPLNFGGTPTLRSHDCGAHEIHKDIKDHSECLLCSRTTLFVAFVVSGLLPSDDAVVFLVVPASERLVFDESCTPLFLRGPPASRS